MFGSRESAKKMKEKGVEKKQEKGRAESFSPKFIMKGFMFTKLDSSLYSVQSKGNYKNKPKHKLLQGVERRKTKTESFEQKNKKQKFSL